MDATVTLKVCFGIPVNCKQLGGSRYKWCSFPLHYVNNNISCMVFWMINALFVMPTSGLKLRIAKGHAPLNRQIHVADSTWNRKVKKQWIDRSNSASTFPPTKRVDVTIIATIVYRNAYFLCIVAGCKLQDLEWLQHTDRLPSFECWYGRRAIGPGNNPPRSNARQTHNHNTVAFNKHNIRHVTYTRSN